MDGHSQDPLLGRVIAGKLELRKLLGEGAMGKVYLAHHDVLDKAVAIKVLLGEGGSERRALRFKAEARAASRLDHPNCVQILDFGEEEDSFSAELLLGKSKSDATMRPIKIPTNNEKTTTIFFLLFIIFLAPY